MIEVKSKTEVYQIKEQILREPTYSIHIAESKYSGNIVNLKIIPKNGFSTEEIILQIEQELKILKILKHEKILQIFEIFNDSDNHYVTYEYFNGISLLNYIKTNGSIRETKFQNIAIQILTSLSYIHSQDIAHCDIRPENILIDEKDNIKITNFGNSVLYGRTSEQFQFKGSLYYSPPEYLENKLFYGVFADMWAIGILFFVCMTGIYPFGHVQPHEFLRAFKLGPKKTTLINDTTMNLIIKCLEIDPLRRYSSSQALDHLWLATKHTNSRPRLLSGSFSAIVNSSNNNNMNLNSNLVHTTNSLNNKSKLSTIASSNVLGFTSPISYLKKNRINAINTKIDFNSKSLLID